MLGEGEAQAAVADLRGGGNNGVAGMCRRNDSGSGGIDDFNLLSKTEFGQLHVYSSENDLDLVYFQIFLQNMNSDAFVCI